MLKPDRQFQQTVRAFYVAHGRHTLPWRKTKDPYKILVSEVMLQQTQVDRVLPKYERFIGKWGTLRELVRAPLGDVLKEWQGLGYNRRAKKLHECAKEVSDKHEGKFPKTFEELKALPGIGPYTAGAVMAFAYNKPVPIIETNIRTVYIHHFFQDESLVSDAEIVQSIGLTLDQENPREWYWALMDYGAYLKKTIGNQNHKSKHYTKQPKFDGSDRQIRGAIITALTGKSHTRSKLHKHLSQFEDVRIDAQLEKLLSEEMIQQQKRSFMLPG